MALTTSLAGRVGNTTLPKSHALLPLLEAVVNGLQAIDARGDDIGHGRLKVTIERSAQEAFDFGPSSPGRASPGRCSSTASGTSSGQAEYPT